MDEFTMRVGPDVSNRVRSHSPLAHPDYVDHASLSTPIAAEASPQRWARAMFGDTPQPAARFIWSGLLRLRLEPAPSPDNVAGLRIAERADRWIRLEADSAMLTCQLVIHVDHDRLSLETFMRYHRWRGSLIWTLLAPVHRRLAPGLLRTAESTMRVELASAQTPSS